MPPLDKNSIINKLESLRKNNFSGNSHFKNSGLGNRPLLKKQDIPKPQTPIKKDASIWHGKSQVTRGEIKKELKTLNPRDYRLNMKKYQMADLEKMFPGRFGWTIDHAEAKATAKELYWQIKHEQTDWKNWQKARQDRSKLKLLEDIIDDDSFKL